MAPRDPASSELWLEFLDARFGAQGGRTLVPNTNRESREKHPRVEVYTLLRTDDRFRRKVLAEYKRWRNARIEERRAAPERKKMNLPLPDAVRDLHRTMRDAGHELYVVGGAVRDHVLGKDPKDFDLATDAKPERVIDLLGRNPDYKLDLTGKAFGVVRVHTPDGEEYEIATFREDVGEGRRPDAVKFTTIDEDVKRRDLTINALFYDLDRGEVVDYVGGLDDIKNGVIRTVGDPDDRFREDRLRILRALRFAGRLDSRLDKKMSEAIKRNPDLHEVSPERIRDEFVRGISSAKDRKAYLKMVEDHDLFDQIFPGLKVNHDYTTEGIPALQLAALLRDNKPKDVERVLRQMKWTNEEIDQALFLLRMRDLNAKEAPMLKKGYRRFKMKPFHLVEASRILGKPSAKEVRAFVDFAGRPPAVTGNELMARGLKGKAIGEAMEKAEREAYRDVLENA